MGDFGTPILGPNGKGLEEEHVSTLPKHTPEQLAQAKTTAEAQRLEGQDRMKQSIPVGWPHAYNMNSQGEKWDGHRSLSTGPVTQIPPNVETTLSEMLTPTPEVKPRPSTLPDWIENVEPVPDIDLNVPEGDELVVNQAIIVESLAEVPDPKHPLNPYIGKFIQSGSQEHREYAVAQLLMALGVDLNDANFKETPRRMAAYMSEHFKTGAMVAKEVEELKRAVFPSKYGDMVTERGIKTSGMCPHHLLPVQYTIDVGYLPGDFVIGISKLARIPMLLAGLPILQEDYTHQIAAAMQQVLGVEDVAVVVKGVHMCMVVRGVEQEESDTVTSVMCGKFLENFRDCKNEFLALARK